MLKPIVFHRHDTYRSFNYTYGTINTLSRKAMLIRITCYENNICFNFYSFALVPTVLLKHFITVTIWFIHLQFQKWCAMNHNEPAIPHWLMNYLLWIYVFYFCFEWLMLWGILYWTFFKPKKLLLERLCQFHNITWKYKAIWILFPTCMNKYGEKASEKICIFHTV